MVPHHQGAIDMAQAELRYGRNEQLRRLAREIIVTQHEEIAAMRLAIGQPLPSAPSRVDKAVFDRGHSAAYAEDRRQSPRPAMRCSTTCGAASPRTASRDGACRSRANAPGIRRGAQSPIASSTTEELSA